MADILNITGLGRLEIVETYVYYDQPVLFSCKSAAGHLYLGVAAYKNDQHETWLYVGISAARLNLVRCGAIDLHDAFAEPEDDFLLQEIVPYDDQAQPRMEPIQPDQISEDMLPIPGERLDLETDTLSVLRDSEEITKLREVVELLQKSQGKATPRFTIPCTLSGVLLNQLEKLLQLQSGDQDYKTNLE